MTLKAIRNRINKKIDERYKARQRIITKIKDSLNIDFNKISVYKTEINIKKNNTADKNGQKEDNIDYVLFKVEIPSSMIASSRFYYKGQKEKWRGFSRLFFSRYHPSSKQTLSANYNE